MSRNAACMLACVIMLQARLNGLTSYESRVQKVGNEASDEISRLNSPKELEEKLQTLNRLWADIARKLGG